jgi:hypothetical protein
MTTLEFEGQLHRATVEHEAAHATAALLTGMVVEQVEVRRMRDKAVGNTQVRASDDEVGQRACAMTVLCGRMAETDDPGDTWPPSFDALMHPQHDDSDDTNDLRGLVKELRSGERGYDLLCLEATKLACSEEFVTLHQAIADELARRGGRLEEQDITAIRAKARKPKPQASQDVERDEHGVISDAQADADIDQLRASRAVAGNGDLRPPTSESKELVSTKTKAEAFEARLIEAVVFSR